MVNDLVPGPGSGTEVYVMRLARGLEAAGHDVEVFTPEAPHVGLGRIADVWDRRARRRLRRRAPAFDVVHVHNFARELSASVLGATGAVPQVLTVHDHRLFEQDRPGLRWSPASLGLRAVAHLTRRRVRRHVACVMAVTHEISDRLHEAGLGPVTVVPPFADPWRQRPPPPTGSDIAFAGRLSRGKGIGVLVDAFRVLAGVVPAARLRIAGVGPDRDAVIRQVHSAGLDGRVTFEGLLDEQGVRRLLAHSRVVCVPSVRREGLPTVIVEAMLAGRPVVATDQPAIRAALDDGRRGLLVPAGDPAPLAAALAKVLLNDVTARTLASVGQQAAEQEFTTAAVVDRVEAVYRDVLARMRVPV